MNILLVIDADTRNQISYEFDSVEAVEEIRWEDFHNGQDRKFAQQDAYVGDLIYPALFLNTLTVKPQTMSILPDGRLYVTVETI